MVGLTTQGAKSDQIHGLFKERVVQNPRVIVYGARSDVAPGTRGVGSVNGETVESDSPA